MVWCIYVNHTLEIRSCFKAHIYKYDVYFYNTSRRKEIQMCSHSCVLTFDNLYYMNLLEVFGECPPY